MRVQVRPLNIKGKALKKLEVQGVAPCRGNLKLLEDRLHSLNRVVTCARVTSISDGLALDLLPELLDATLIWIEGDMMRIRGVESIDKALYGQTWEIKVL